MPSARAVNWKVRVRLVVAIVCLGVLASMGPLDRLTGAEVGVDAAGGAVIAGDRVGFSPGATILSSTSADLARELDLLVATGAEWLRVDFAWPALQQTQTRFDWTVPDRIVAAATQRGIHVLGLVSYAPSWVGDPSSAGAPAAYASFMTQVVNRYKGQGVHHWEVWNEPNLPQFWGGTVNPEAYTRILQAAYPAIKAADPTATVITAGLAPAVDGGGTLSPLTFLTRMYAAGARGSFDAVGSHPYSFPARPDDRSTASWNQFQKLPLLHDVMVQNGDGAKDIWLTEYGAPTGTGENAVTPDRQAELLVAGLASANQDWIGPIFLYALRDAGTDPADREQVFGIVARDFTPKPAVAALTEAIASDGEATPALPTGWITMRWPNLSSTRTVVVRSTSTGAPVVSGSAPSSGTVDVVGGTYQVELTQAGTTWWSMTRTTVSVPAGGGADAGCAGPSAC